MRIRSIDIIRWRHFENIALHLSDDAGLICIVGANGTGKSNLLELIAACAHQLGLSPGFEIPRGDPFAEVHEFSLQFYLAMGVSDAIDQGLSDWPGFKEWDRTLTIKSRKSAGSQGGSMAIEGGGIADTNLNVNLTRRVIELLRLSKEVHFLSLDADRAYPMKNMQIHEIVQAYQTNWETQEYTRGRSFRTSTTLYDEWIKYFLAQENQASSHFAQSTRRAETRRRDAEVR